MKNTALECQEEIEAEVPVEFDELGDLDETPDEWAHYDFSQELNGEFDETDCLEAVDHSEGLVREDVVRSEELLFELPELAEEWSASNFDCDEDYQELY